jgi:hypothetical protein
MTNKNDIFKEGKEGEADLLDFEFDELPEEDIEKSADDSTTEGKIIELVDMVDDAESDEIAKLLEEGETFEDETQSDLKEDQISAEAQEALEEVPEGLDTDLDSALESLESAEEGEIDFELLETDLETELEADSLEGAGFDLEELVEAEAAEKAPEPSVSEETQKLMEEDLSEAEEAPEVQIAGQQTAPVAEASSGISEEQIEAVVTRVVQEVVERVVRETMTTVAERTITKAIDALKQSLESSE